MAPQQITISIPDGTVLAHARAMAERQGLSLSEVVYRALRDAVIVDEGARVASAGRLPDTDEAAELAEYDAGAMEGDYRAARRRSTGSV